MTNAVASFFCLLHLSSEWRSLCFWCHWAFAGAFVFLLFLPIILPSVISHSSESCHKMCPNHLNVRCRTVFKMLFFSWILYQPSWFLFFLDPHFKCWQFLGTRASNSKSASLIVLELLTVNNVYQASRQRLTSLISIWLEIDLFHTVGRGSYIVFC